MSRPEDLENGRHAVRGIIAYDQAIAPYLSDDRIMGVTEAFFGKHVRISMTTGVILHPGYPRTDNPGGGLHSDWPFGQSYDYRIPAPYPDAPLLLTSLWMLTPFTRENGGTVLVPGSHKASNNPTGDSSLVPGTTHPSEIQAEGKPGSVLLFDSRTWHINGHNNSDETRMADHRPVRGVVVQPQPDYTRPVGLRTRCGQPGIQAGRRRAADPGAIRQRCPNAPGPCSTTSSLGRKYSRA